jgi:uncharacterized protein
MLGSMVDATPAEQRRLLRLQQLDSRIAQLRRGAGDPLGQRAADASAAELRRVARELTAAADRLQALRAAPPAEGSPEAIRSAQQTLAGIRRRGEALAAEHRRLAAATADAPARLAAALAGLQADRETAAAVVPAPLLHAYDAARGRLGEPAVVPVLDGRTCGGCHLAIPAMELDAARRASMTRLPACPECDRLLVFEPLEPAA